VKESDWDTSLSKLQYLAKRSERHGSVPFAEAFVRSKRLGLLLGSSGGRGGDVRLKLYITITMLAVGKKNEVTNTPASSWAQALGLPEPSGAGSRRVVAALRWLEQNKFIAVTRAAGRPFDIRLLDPMGTGRAYTRPNRGKARYVRVPLDLWSQGWLLVLTGRSIAVLIVILDRLGTKRLSCWIPQEDRSTRIDISDATWTRALRELGATGHNLVIVKREPLGSSDDFDWNRFRNTYSVNRPVLANAPVNKIGYQATRKAL